MTTSKEEESPSSDQHKQHAATAITPYSGSFTGMLLIGQIVHLRKCYKRLFFIDLRIDNSTKHTILFRSDDTRGESEEEQDTIPTLTDLELTKLWKRTKRGDIIELCCFQASDDERSKRDHQVYQAVDFKVLKAWPDHDPFPSEPAMGMKQDADAVAIVKQASILSQQGKKEHHRTNESSSFTTKDDSWRDYCKFWINSHKCIKDNCKLKHPTGEEYTQIQEMWVIERTADRKRRARILEDPHAVSSKVPHARRAFIFARWIVGTFGRDYLNSGSGVLDIAGGKGEISLFLTHMFGIRSTVVEPNVRRDKPYQRRNLMDVIQRQMDLEAGGDGVFYRGCQSSSSSLKTVSITTTKTTTTTTRPPLSLLSQQREIQDNDKSDDETKQKKLWRIKKKQQLEQFVVPRLNTLMNDQFEDQFPGVLASASILIGMHPDQATEPTVDMALKHHKPFAVVPCCVFAHENPDRRLKDGGDVNTTFDFIQYLMEKKELGSGCSSRSSNSLGSMQKEFLPFDGMNIVVYRGVNDIL
ncbi:hypothetical protein BG004_000535 [Podila humilis]|nr:hypothetical protein BG004_000535 [Podila humilis]